MLIVFVEHSLTDPSEKPSHELGRGDLIKVMTSAYQEVEEELVCCVMIWKRRVNSYSRGNSCVSCGG